ncbi:hypothetical protein DRJ25_05040 [Candidatus Woesearchaeota archaeon]|nr:MAG: hypothetical protein DRJ25_05040 [Candidatus Woesearchaeota archaeon]
MDDVVLPEYMQRRREGASSLSFRAPTRPPMRFHAPVRKPDVVSDDDINQVYEVMASLDVLLFPTFDRFSQKPELKYQAILVFGKLPSLSFLQQYAADPVSVTHAKIDYYKVVGRIIKNLDSGLKDDAEKIKQYALAIQNARDQLDRNPHLANLMLKAQTIKEKYVQLALQVLELLETIAMNDYSKVFRTILDKTELELDRRTRESEEQKEARAELENEQEKKILEVEAERSKEKWSRKLEKSLEQVKINFILAKKKLEEQMNEYLALLDKKYDDELQHEILKIDNEFKEKELECEKKYFEDRLREQKTSNIDYASAKKRYTVTLDRATRLKKVNNLISTVASDIVAGRASYSQVSSVAQIVRSIMNNLKDRTQPDVIHDYSKIEDFGLAFNDVKKK